MSNEYDKFKSYPKDTMHPDCVTLIVCSHPYHGVETFYLGLDDFHENIIGLLTPFWVNNCTITITPCR